MNKHAYSEGNIYMSIHIYTSMCVARTFNSYKCSVHNFTLHTLQQTDTMGGGGREGVCGPARPRHCTRLANTQANTLIHTDCPVDFLRSFLAKLTAPYSAHTHSCTQADIDTCRPNDPPPSPHTHSSYTDPNTHCFYVCTVYTQFSL